MPKSIAQPDLLSGSAASGEVLSCSGLGCSATMRFCLPLHSEQDLALHYPRD